MSENLNLKMHLEARDDASPAIRRLVQEFKALETQAKRTFAAFSKAPDLGLGKIEKALQGQAQAFAKVEAAATRMFSQGTRESSIAEKARKSTIRDLEEQIRLTDRLARAQSSANRQVEAGRRAGGAARGGGYGGGSSFRAAAGSARSIINTTGLATTIAAAVTASVTKGILQAAKSLDTAVTEAAVHVFNEDGVAASLAKAQAMRGKAIGKAINLGMKPAEYVQGLTEGSQAGISDKYLDKATEYGVKLSKLLGTTLPETMESMGKALYSLEGLGRIKNADDIRKTFNMIAGLAGQTAATRREMVSFARTGMGAGAKLGMSSAGTLAFGAAATSAGAQGNQASRALSEIAGRLPKLSLEARNMRRKGNLQPSDIEFLNAPRELGFGSYEDIERRMRADPDHFLFQLLGSFNKVQDPAKRERLRSKMLGNTFGPLFANLGNTAGQNLGMVDQAKKLESQSEDVDYITTAWKKWTSALEFMISQISSTFEALKDEIGDALKPFVSEFRDYFVNLQGSFANLKSVVQASLRGLIQGLGGKDGSLADLLRQWIGDPGKAGFDASKFRDFFAGFGEGVRSVIESFKSIATMFTGGGDPAAMGKLAGQILALSAALVVLSPVLGTLSAITSLVTTLGTLAAVASGGALAAGVAAFAAAVSAFLLLRDPKKAIVDGGKPDGQWNVDELLPGVKPETGNKVRAWVDPPAKPKAPQAPKYLDGSTPVWKQSATGDWHGLIQKASLSESVEDLSENVKRLGGVIQLAALSSPGSVGSGFTGGGAAGSYGGSVGGGARGFASSGASAMITNKPGAALPGGALGRRGIIGGRSDTTPGAGPGADVPIATHGTIAGLGKLGTSQYANILGKRESGNRYGIRNSYGYSGRYQMGAGALQETGYFRSGRNGDLNNPALWTDKARAAGVNNLQDFLANKNGIQDKQFVEYTNKHYRELVAAGVIKPGMAPNEVAGWLAAAHLKGVGSKKRMNGAIGLYYGHDNFDANGTSASSYKRMMAGIRGGDGPVAAGSTTAGDGAKRALGDGFTSTGWQKRGPSMSPPTADGLASSVSNTPAGRMGDAMMLRNQQPVVVHQTIHGGQHSPEELANLVQRRLNESTQQRYHDTDYSIA
ncbi:phage tail tape measure protein [Methylobacterium oxalidis]|uniref:Phage tail tape measure protein domain-containing protein n=1 Tax=Methylobacterium oxalidis TaxID=944322 RepID=A0A512IX26_9HYPH|nr:phage tail tape measure protein [Methylobacterium oxalidis]GEP02278.1 hypothetical protein MOX02_03160 [Methylobacterium oxalidis]GJE32268.1 hypothetical protein LDDCCGHA_2454 [Methylobacterium oxalidis]GLS62223.1 hypothetical protein GCM10007888_06040 [Methylobacterium oxalidis]